MSRRASLSCRALVKKHLEENFNKKLRVQESRIPSWIFHISHLRKFGKSSTQNCLGFWDMLVPWTGGYTHLEFHLPAAAIG